MESEKKEKIIEMIKAIENKNTEMKEYISSLSILSRNELLKEITREIINNNSLIQELLGTEVQFISREKEVKTSIDNIIEDYINKIQKNPYKKVIFLREFLESFHDQISETDKDVILKSLKDEENDEKLKERMVFLANTFELKL
ncbi:MAG: hypothetical protein ACFFB6_00675 [Promethearchaeota archaeon]